ncbi:hypothetical protein K438DRAFT_1960071 [Mycena galopus ATCC 62051]|nr:hypothetical protein K438DRAFT_1960071 [Mycena galopus ATCC 62051]
MIPGTLFKHVELDRKFAFKPPIRPEQSVMPSKWLSYHSQQPASGLRYNFLAPSLWSLCAIASSTRLLALLIATHSLLFFSGFHLDEASGLPPCESHPRTCSELLPQHNAETGSSSPALDHSGVSTPPVAVNPAQQRNSPPSPQHPQQHQYPAPSPYDMSCSYQGGYMYAPPLSPRSTTPTCTLLLSWKPHAYVGIPTVTDLR